ncbi:cytochrome-c peroxidase [Pseudocnuella soli]|uniref:cytochrome-c peroxidase n=1 Tax=Pseudocnuella soli TaxID=2502779 RepID=UPI00104B863E|nr:cytochrome c peroxidase [Pseudocnuella soli]
MKLRLTILSLMVLVLISTIGVQACRKKEMEVPKGPTPVSFDIPQGFPKPEYDFAGNPLTKEGIELGKKLFYDGILSADGNFPCASCHQQFAAFATFDHDLSHGFNDAFTTRNAPGMFNLAWRKEFHHDGGILNLETQPLAPLTAKNEMAETVDNVVRKLRASTKYPSLFAAAFGDAEINSQRMLKALAQFVVTMVSANSKYDKMKRGEATFTQFEQAGYTVFQSKCATCHQEPFFTDGSFRNNGIGLNPFLKDGGRIRITGNAADSMKFLVPSLRNVALTFPYMHDGRFTSLQQSIEHYRSGIKQTPNLDPSLQLGIALTNSDIVNLTAFLKTLTDSSFISDKHFAP